MGTEEELFGRGDKRNAGKLRRDYGFHGIWVRKVELTERFGELELWDKSFPWKWEREREREREKRKGDPFVLSCEFCDVGKQDRKSVV